MDKKSLTQKQLAVIDDLFSGELSEQAVLDKHKVRRFIYTKWHSCEAFTTEFNQRLNALDRQNQLIIANYSSFAAGKLIQLTESKIKQLTLKSMRITKKESKPF